MTNGNKRAALDHVPELMTLDEVARFLRFAKSTIYRLIDSRRLKCFKVAGSYRFNKTDVLGFVQEGCREPLAKNEYEHKFQKG